MYNYQRRFITNHVHSLVIIMFCIIYCCISQHACGVLHLTKHVNYFYIYGKNEFCFLFRGNTEELRWICDRCPTVPSQGNIMDTHNDINLRQSLKTAKTELSINFIITRLNQKTGVTIGYSRTNVYLSNELNLIAKFLGILSFRTLFFFFPS